MRHLVSSVRPILLQLIAASALTLSSTAQAPVPPAAPALPAEDLPSSQLDSSLVRGHVLGLPSPPEFLFVLQKVGSPKWRQLYYPVLRGQESDRAKIALRLGLVIADAHIAAMARDAQKIRDVTNDLQRHAKVLGISDALSERVRSINQLAEAKSWAGVAFQLEALAAQMATTLSAQRDTDLAPLVATGQWVRLLHIATSIVTEKEFPDTSIAISSRWTLEQVIAPSSASKDATIVSIRDQLSKIQRLWAPEKLAGGHKFDDRLIEECHGRLDNVIQLFAK